jgi:hypothetical protein
MVSDGASLLEIAGIAVGLLLFYAPAAMWTGGWVTVGAILVAGLGAAVTHRYRLTETGGALQRTGWVVFVLLLISSARCSSSGVTFLAYADCGMSRNPLCSVRIGVALRSRARGYGRGRSQPG